MMSHSDVRTFECDKCDKKFKKQTHLNKHYRVHTGMFMVSFEAQ